LIEITWLYKSKTQSTKYLLATRNYECGSTFSLHSFLKKGKDSVDKKIGVIGTIEFKELR